jgi:hypothetical protein
MNKSDLFLAAMQAEEFRRKAWVITAFSQIAEAPEAWKQNPYPYRIVQTPAGHFFVDPNNNLELAPIVDAPAGGAPFNLKERVSYAPAQVPQLDSVTDATYGQWLANFTINFWPFGNKIGFLKGRWTSATMEDIIVKRLADDPKMGDPVPKTMDRAAKIYVSEYLKFCDAAFFMAGFTQLCVPAATEKSMVPAPGIRELRKKLLEENKDRLHDPAVIAKIDAELVEYDRAYLKDDPSENFLLGKKSFEIVRKKMFSMHGAEMGLSESVDVKLVKNSLSEGWDINHFDDYNNSLRAGSFNRGAQTMLGGEAVKWLLRASSNIAVTADDCGAKLGNQFSVDGENYKRLTGFTVLVAGQSKPVVTDEDAKSYMGKNLMVRSPMYCTLDKTDYCKACVGVLLAENPTALSSAISEYGSAFLSIYMAAAHGKALTTQKMDVDSAIQ